MCPSCQQPKGKQWEDDTDSWNQLKTLRNSNALDSDSFECEELDCLVKTFWSCWTPVCHQVFRWIAIFPTLALKEIPNSSEGMQWHARLSTCVSICASIVDFELSLSGLNPFEETTSGLFIWFTWFQMRQAWSSAKNRKRWVKWAFKHFQALMGSGLASQASVICLWLSSFYVFFSQISHNSKQLCCSGVLNTGHQRTWWLCVLDLQRKFIRQSCERIDN